MAAAPVCYRHPGRETYVACARCERPICPDCMQPASVGFQCPSCVAEGAKSVRQGRTVFGGAVSGDTSRVSLTLIALNVAVFVLQLAVPLFDQLYSVLLGPVRLSDGSVGGVADGEAYRVLTGAFLHVGPFHLLMNMGALATLGPPLEASLGRVRYLALYLVSALGSSALVLLLSAPNRGAIGASGALFGLMAAALLAARATGQDTSFFRQYLVFGAVLSIAGPVLGFPISWEGHLGGALTGALVALALVVPRRSPRRSALQASGLASVTVLVLAVTALAALGGSLLPG